MLKENKAGLFDGAGAWGLLARVGGENASKEIIWVKTLMEGRRPTFLCLEVSAFQMKGTRSCKVLSCEAWHVQKEV